MHYRNIYMCLLITWTIIVITEVINGEEKKRQNVQALPSLAWMAHTYSGCVTGSTRAWIPTPRRTDLGTSITRPSRFMEPISTIIFFPYFLYALFATSCPIRASASRIFSRRSGGSMMDSPHFRFSS